MTNTNQAILETLFDLKPSTKQARQLQIAEAAIANYASLGFDRTTFDRIAQTCGISRPLIHRYFKDKYEIFAMSVKFIRTHMQNYAIDAISQHNKIDLQLKAYIESTFSWTKNHPQYAQTWLLFFYQASLKKEFRKLMTDINQVGQKRIVALIENGIQEQIFECEDPFGWAKWIQTAITGALVTMTTEKLSVDKELFKNRILEQCFQGLNCPVP